MNINSHDLLIDVENEYVKKNTTKQSNKNKFKK